MNSRLLIIFFILFSLLFVAKNEALAQQGFPTISEEDVYIKSTPEIPDANQQIEIEISSFSFNLDNVKIDWKIDGKIQVSGTGLKKLLMTTGGLGVKKTVTASIFDINTGVRFDKTIIIEPSNLDVLWEVTDGYAHHFYKGKVLPISESSIKMVAIPNRQNQTTLAQKNLVYTWKRNFSVMGSNSGFGKQTFSFRNDYLKNSENISVTASATGYSSAGSFDFVFYKPIILFFQKKDGVGVDYWRAIGDGVSVGSSEFSLIAEPFFMTPKNKNDSALKYTWKVNGSSITTPEYKSFLTIRGDGGSGTSNVELEVINQGRLFQKTSRVMRINVLGN